MSEQTWTDEQLRDCLDTLNKQIQTGDNPTFCLHAMPHRFPWCDVRYILEHENEKVELTLPQAYQVEAWLNQHTTANPPAREKHDGKLDETEGWFHADVEHSAHVGDIGSKDQIPGIHIHGGYGDCESECIYLEGKQALSLLAWLKQEEVTLEQLVQEQGE